MYVYIYRERVGPARSVRSPGRGRLGRAEWGYFFRFCPGEIGVFLEMLPRQKGGMSTCEEREVARGVWNLELLLLFPDGACRVPAHLRRGLRVEGAGCRMQGAGLRVEGAGCRGEGAGCRVQGAGLRVQGARLRVQGAGLRVQGAGLRVLTLDVQCSGPSAPLTTYFSCRPRFPAVRTRYTLNINLERHSKEGSYSRFRGGRVFKARSVRARIQGSSAPRRRPA